MLRHLLLDLDDTVYAPECGLWPAIGERIHRYMVERLGLTPEEAAARRHRYFDAFGTTLNGLRHDFEVDAEDYLAFVHDLPLERYLRPDPALAGMLARLPLSKSIFTNADAPHARRVLAQLGVARHFERIIDIHALGFINKPDPRAYTRALELLGAPAEACVFVEDSRRNLLPARALGMLTVWVGGGNRAAVPAPADVDYAVERVTDLERVLAGLIGQVR